ncbi:Peptidase family S41 [Pedobacter westerhofensis]|uniref:Peptidase family S41 n=1 Tax=Pedobacter westerhofensis TaxID=425512 RepID=A0A521E8D3_9SPHI|nr:S41 family peptidase [Pedobacter westerhofensis]SMO80208.1 Peptidase family S41 [Pedobacter westerhofensis]
MKKLFTKKRFSIFSVCILFLGGLAACKKNNSDENTTTTTGTTTVPTTGSRKQLTLDSIFLYAKQIYFWNDALPEYSVFNPRQYSAKTLDLDNYDDELYAISQLKKDPTTGVAYEYYGDGYPKYSYINDITQNNPDATANVNNKASVDTEGNGFDIGIRPIFYLTSASGTSGSFRLMITAVYPGSSAATNGVQRGWQIQKINDVAIAGTNYSSENAAIVNSLAGSSVKIEGINYITKAAFSVTLTKTSYKSSPVYTSSVITRSGKKIGYLAFARFSTLTNLSGGTDANLDPVFASFSAAGVTDMVVDLRYNGGGYINTAEYLANLIAPSSVGNGVMFTEIYNTTMQNKQATILQHQPLLTAAGKLQYKSGSSGAFYTYGDQDYSATSADNITKFSKKGSLNTVTNVVFLVSGSTASASELLINSLKPYVTVKLVGATTYGKPVGFFPITLENRYEVFMPLFETVNSKGEGKYYTGMVPDQAVSDPSYYPFGNENESLLSAALTIIAPGSTSQSASSAVADRTARAAATDFTGTRPVNPNSEFTGMIEKRRTVKK